MARYQVILAYDGTDFDGFQRQVQGKKRRTIQGALEHALKQIGWQGSSILAAGRTDSGVHAFGQVAAFDLEWRHSEAKLLTALNSKLPVDMCAREVFQTRPDFHPRYDALARSYRYRILCQPLRDPLRERYAWRVWPAPELASLQATAQQLIGEHDFAAFGSPLHSGGSTVRRIFEAGWQEDEDELVFEITGNAFLYRMVRRLVGFQVSVGQGRLDVSEVCKHLETGTRNIVKVQAPARGLALMRVIYPLLTAHPVEPGNN